MDGRSDVCVGSEAATDSWGSMVSIWFWSRSPKPDSSSDERRFPH